MPAVRLIQNVLDRAAVTVAVMRVLALLKIRCGTRKLRELHIDNAAKAIEPVILGRCAMPQVDARVVSVSSSGLIVHPTHESAHAIHIVLGENVTDSATIVFGNLANPAELVVDRVLESVRVARVCIAEPDFPIVWVLFVVPAIVVT